MKSKNLEYNGVWFIDNEQEIRLDGILTINYSNKTQVLELYTQTDFNGATLSIPFRNIQRKYTYIYGKVNNHCSITLCNCHFKRLSHIGKQLFKLDLVVDSFFEGDCAFSMTKDKVINITCRYPYISALYDTNKLAFGSNFHENNYLNEFKYAFKKDERVSKININKNLTIAIERVYQPNTLQLNLSNKVSNEMIHLVHFTLKDGECYEKILDYAYSFMELIKFSTGKLLYTNIISIDICSDSKDRQYNQLYVNRFDSTQKRDLVNSEFIHQNDLLLRGGDNYYDELNSVIIKWFETYHEYSAIYNSFLETLDWFQDSSVVLSKVMFHNRLANLSYALENYHTIINKPQERIETKEQIKKKASFLLGDLIPEDDKEWLLMRLNPQFVTFSQRISDLIIGDKALCLSKEIFVNKEEKKKYIYYIKEFRNDIAHGRATNLEIKKISGLYYSSLLLLVNCILNNLGLSEEKIIEKIKRNNIYGGMITDARQLFS